MTRAAADAFLEFTRRRAKEAASLPPQEREDYYARMHATGMRAAVAKGTSEEEARSLADQSVAFTRALVGLTEADIPHPLTRRRVPARGNGLAEKVAGK